MERGWNPKGGGKEGENMKISINNKLFYDNSVNEIFNKIDSNSYNSIGEAITDKITNAIHNTEWFQTATPHKFDLVQNFDHVQAICGDYTGGLGSGACYMDALNWSIMNKTELTKEIYKFIAERAAVMRDGFQNNLIHGQHFDFGGIFNLIDWHFILDCISWFF